MTQITPLPPSADLRLHICSPLLILLQQKLLVPTPDLSHAILLSPSLAAPLAPIGARDYRPVGRSEPSLTACIRRAPANACLAVPDSTRPGAPAPGVSLLDCAAYSGTKRIPRKIWCPVVCHSLHGYLWRGNRKLLKVQGILDKCKTIWGEGSVSHQPDFTKKRGVICHIGRHLGYHKRWHSQYHFR